MPGLRPAGLRQGHELRQALGLEPDWNRSYRRLLAYLAAGGTVDGPTSRTGLGDDPAFRPGAWLRKQATARIDGKLTEQQCALLDALTRHAMTVTG